MGGTWISKDGMLEQMMQVADGDYRAHATSPGC